MSPMFRCPCCGYRTLKRAGVMELCPVCWWEDDGQEDADATEVRLTVNGDAEPARGTDALSGVRRRAPPVFASRRRPEASEQ